MGVCCFLAAWIGLEVSIESLYLKAKTTERRLVLTQFDWRIQRADDVFEWEEREAPADRAPQGDSETIRARKSIGTRQTGLRVVCDEHRDEPHDEIERYEAPTQVLEKVRCGETCTETPETCVTECKDTRNGFAKCRDKCTGGGRRCETKYCDELVEKKIWKERTVKVVGPVCVRSHEEPILVEFVTWEARQTSEGLRIVAGRGDPIPAALAERDYAEVRFEALDVESGKVYRTCVLGPLSEAENCQADWTTLGGPPTLEWLRKVVQTSDKVEFVATLEPQRLPSSVFGFFANARYLPPRELWLKPDESTTIGVTWSSP